MKKVCAFDELKNAAKEAIKEKVGESMKNEMWKKALVAQKTAKKEAKYLAVSAHVSKKYCESGNWIGSE